MVLGEEEKGEGEGGDFVRGVNGGRSMGGIYS